MLPLQNDRGDLLQSSNDPLYRIKKIFLVRHYIQLF